MENIPDDPIISCIERTGYPPWMQDDDSEDFFDHFFSEEDETFIYEEDYR